MIRRLFLPGLALFAPAAGLHAQYCEDFVAPPSPEANAWFGESVSVDGDTLAVGAPREDAGTPDGGAVHLFEHSPGGWTHTTSIPYPGPTASGANFGSSVALSGNTLAIGCGGEQVYPEQGALYVYERSGGTWNQILHYRHPQLASCTNSSSGVGWHVALDGDVLVAGAPSDCEHAINGGKALLFERTGGAWSGPVELVSPTLGWADYGNMGWHMAVSGPTVLAASYGSDYSGWIHVFEKVGGAWTEVDILTAPSPTVALFGPFCAIDGDSLIVRSGSYPSVAFHVFNEVGGGWQFEHSIGNLGYCVSKSGWTLFSQSGSSPLRLFQREAPAWIEAAQLHTAGYDPVPGLSPPWLVAGSPHTDLGANDTGAVYVRDMQECVTIRRYCVCPNGPCGNDEVATGCRNSTGQGALLEGHGSSSVSANSLWLWVEQLPPDQFGMFYMGGSRLSLPFGDGLRCVGSGGQGISRFPVDHTGSAGGMDLNAGLLTYAESFLQPRGLEMQAEVGAGEAYVAL